jgi:hypothetical protein
MSRKLGQDFEEFSADVRKIPEVASFLDENITVLPDESIGGVLREYREVKRKANVGERVRVFNHAMPSVDGIHTVCGVSNNGHAELTNRCGARFDHYVVLEPSDIIRVKGSGGQPERLRMVERKAAVGERILVVTDDDGGYYYRKGSVAAVKKGGKSNVYANLNGNNYVRGDGFWYVNHDHYRVLEAFELSAQQPPAPSDLARQVEGLTEALGKLALRIERMDTELRVAREDVVLIEEGVAGDIRSIEKRLGALDGGKRKYTAQAGVSE